MIRCDLRVENRILTSLAVEGHAAGRSESAVLCAGVSCLLRSAAEALAELESRSLLRWEFDLPSEGTLRWELRSWADETGAVLEGISGVVLCGLGRLAGEFPEQLRRKVNGKIDHL